MDFSPLFWPVHLKGSTIYTVDETRLPQKLSYVHINDYQDSCTAIKTMKTRAVGQVLLVFYTFLLHLRQMRNEKSLLPLVKKIARRLNAARPTLSFKMLTDLVITWAGNHSTLEDTILRFLEDLRNKRIEQAKEASRLFDDGDVILTHCNISGTLPLVGQFCREQQKKISFFVTETRPYFQGSRLSAWELHRAGFAVSVIPDSAVAHVFARGLVSKVITGADHLARNGDIANKIGTFQIALLAKEFNIPFYVLTPPPSEVRTGNNITVEVRPDRELLTFAGQRLGPLGVTGYYPAFDITPASLISTYIPLRIQQWKRES